MPAMSQVRLRPTAALWYAHPPRATLAEASQSTRASSVVAEVAGVGGHRAKTTEGSSRPIPLKLSKPKLFVTGELVPYASSWFPAAPVESVATPQVARGWARPPYRHFKIQSCCCLASAFELAVWNPWVFGNQHQPVESKWRAAERRLRRCVSITTA